MEKNDDEQKRQPQCFLNMCRSRHLMIIHKLIFHISLFTDIVILFLRNYSESKRREHGQRCGIRRGHFKSGRSGSVRELIRNELSEDELNFQGNVISAVLP